MYHHNEKHLHCYLVALGICFLACYCAPVHCASIAPPLFTNLTTRTGLVSYSATPPTDIIDLFSNTPQPMDHYSQGTPMEGGGNPTEKVSDRPTSTREGPKPITVGLALVTEKINALVNVTLPYIIDNVHESPISTENVDSLTSKSSSPVDLLVGGLPVSNSLEVDSKSSKIHARKGAELSTIVGRKGAVLEEDEKYILNTSTISSTLLPKMNTTSNTPVVQSSYIFSVTKFIPPTELNVNLTETSNITSPNPKSNTSLDSSSVLPTNRNVTTAHIEGLSKNSTDVKTDTKGSIFASYPPLKKKPKPLKTVDTDSFPDSTVLKEHALSQHEYVIPVVVAILTFPMLIVIVLFLYKKGSEFWERRHYRRMDFLIDGMYND